MIHYITTNGIGNPWVVIELKELHRQGIPFILHSMRSANVNFFGEDWANQLGRDTNVLYPLPLVRLITSVCIAPLKYRGRFFAALGNALFGKRESLRNRIAALAHFFVACHWVRTLATEEVTAIHAQWIHSCGTIGMYGAWLLGKPFGFTGHAADLFRQRVALEDKIRRADLIVCISEFHRAFYMEHGATPDKLMIVHCGIDVDRFAYEEPRPRNGSVHVLSVGRLVDKKGFEYLIDACALLRDQQVSVRCTIGGDGPLEDSLRARIQRLGLEEHVQLPGKGILQENLVDFLRTGDIFAQPCVWAQDNDVDGTPRTLMEAMACGLPSISTRLAGIPDIIEDGVSGILVEQRDAAALAAAIRKLAEDIDLRRSLSRAGRQQIERQFKLPECLEPLVQAMRQRSGMADQGASRL